MKITHTNSRRILAAVAVSALLATGLVSQASAAPDADHKMEQNRVQHRQEWLKARLAKTAERLGIQPAQQHAWQAYADAIASPIGTFHKDKDAPTDAASIARRRANMAAGHAAKLAKIADATAALQAVLTPDQRQKFDRIAQHAGHHRHRGWHRHGDMPHASRAVAPAAPSAPTYQ